MFLSHVVRRWPLRRSTSGAGEPLLGLPASDLKMTAMFL
jgi:hypothetical protein